jgi:putative chitinase
VTTAIITVAALVAAGLQPTQARLFAEPLQKACTAFDIGTPARMGAFVAQCLVESQGFTRLEENCRWSTPERILKFFPREVPNIDAAMQLVNAPEKLANVVYANKNGNAGPESGDGWAYRGRGVLMLTGRHNYYDASVELGRPYVETPDLVGMPEDACLTAAWFWNTHRLNVLADAGLSDAITRQINGPAMDQAQLRKQRTEEAVRAFA